MFDPEKVERANPAGIAGMKRAIDGRWAPSSAYDELLKLYRAEKGSKDALLVWVKKMFPRAPVPLGVHPAAAPHPQQPANPFGDY